MTVGSGLVDAILRAAREDERPRRSTVVTAAELAVTAAWAWDRVADWSGADSGIALKLRSDLHAAGFEDLVPYERAWSLIEGWLDHHERQSVGGVGAFAAWLAANPAV